MNQQTKRLTGLALLTALTVIIQLLGSFIKFGIFSISLVLLPIVIGAALYGTKGGVWLGLVFGLAVLMSGDASAFLAVNVPGTIVTVIGKGLLAGLAAGIAYNTIKKEPAASFAAAIVTPIVNTGVFVICCFIFFMDTLEEWGAAFGFGSATEYLIFGMVGLNFLVELAINLILIQVCIRLINIGKKS